MPRNTTVDYPQVHPPSAQRAYGLAPPQFHDEGSRFSWQGAPSQAAERQLEGGSINPTQELGQSKVPPLPVLPESLVGSEEEQEHQYQEQTHSQAQAQPVYPVQHKNEIPHQSQAQSLQYQYQQLQQQQLQQIYLRQQYLQQQHLLQQQSQSQPQSHYTSPPVSYELSQATHQPLNPAQANGHHVAQTPGDHYESSDHKPVEHESQIQKPTTVHIAPDINPLSPTSPTRSMMSDQQQTTTMRSYPPPEQPHTNYPQPSPSTGPIRGGTWHHTLGSCAEPTTCLSSLFCPCIVYGRTQYRLGLKSSQRDPTNMLGYSAINGSCIAWSVLCGANILLTAIQHRRVRKAYEMDEIAGSAGSDCIKSACCCCCILAQDEKEMRAREEKSRKSGDAAMAERGYQSPVGMTFAAPPR